jgi:branched-chain amino acid transport system substrate-binding protein
MISRRAAVAGGVAAITAASLRRTRAADAKSIKIGNTMPYSGPASTYGVIGRTESAFFKMLNEQGGIAGHTIDFISYDDGYSPPKTVEQVRRLVEEDNVDFCFQNLGTPCNSAIADYLNRKKIPHLFVGSGASKWADIKKYPWTMGFQPGYRRAGRAWQRLGQDRRQDRELRDSRSDHRFADRRDAEFRPTCCWWRRFRNSRRRRSARCTR